MAGGRPKHDINWDEFDKLCTIQCSLPEFALYFKCTEKTIRTAVKRTHKMSFYQYFELKRQGGYISLRRVQWQKALQGNVPLIIWLSKQFLGQKENPQMNVIIENNLPKDDADLQETQRILHATETALPAPLIFNPTKGLLSE